MKPDLSWDQKAANVINLVGLGIFAAGVLWALAYFVGQSAHPLKDLLAIPVAVVLVGLLRYAGRRGARR
jgi:hypothetical protein